MRALKERLEAIPALRKAQHTPDLEVRRRVNDILSVLERRRAKLGLAKAKVLGKAGRAVEVADRLAIAAIYNVEGDEGWDSLAQFANQLTIPTERYFPTGWKSYCNRVMPVGGFRRFAKQSNPKEIAQRTVEIYTGREEKPKNRRALPDPKAMAGIRLIRETKGTLLLRGEEVSLTGSNPGWGLGLGMIAASGDVQVISAAGSVIVAGGDVKKVMLLNYGCFVISDGDVDLSDAIEASHSIIIARGKVIYDKDKIKLTNCLIRSGHTLRLPDGKTIDLKDGKSDPLAFVKFFELADVGLAAEDLPSRDKSAKGVRLKEVRKESPFAVSLRAGDVITAVEEKKTSTTEIFRRVLRRKLAEGGPILIITVRRADKTLDVPIPVKD